MGFGLGNECGSGSEGSEFSARIIEYGRRNRGWFCCGCWLICHDKGREGTTSTSSSTSTLQRTTGPGQYFAPRRRNFACVKQIATKKKKKKKKKKQISGRGKERNLRNRKKGERMEKRGGSGNVCHRSEVIVLLHVL